MDYVFLFCKQKTGYELRISDWSSDVCSSALGNREILGVDGNALLAQLGDLVAQRPRIEDDAVADDRQRAGDDTRRQQRQLVHLLADDERMAGIMTALEADHGVGAAREPIDDLRSEENTSELQSLMRISYAVFCLNKKNNTNRNIS